MDFAVGNGRWIIWIATLGNRFTLGEKDIYGSRISLILVRKAFIEIFIPLSSSLRARDPSWLGTEIAFVAALRSATMARVKESFILAQEANNSGLIGKSKLRYDQGIFRC